MAWRVQGCMQASWELLHACMCAWVGRDWDAGAHSFAFPIGAHEATLPPMQDGHR